MIGLFIKINHIKLVKDICNEMRYKNTIKYNIKKNMIEFTHKDTYSFAEEQGEYWGSYIIVENIEDNYSLKLSFNLKQCIENKNLEELEEIKEEIHKYSKKKIRSTTKRVIVLKYDNESKRSLIDKFYELFAILKKLQKLYLPK